MTSAPQATMGRDLASGAAHPHVCATPPIFAGVASIQSTLLLPCPEKLVFAQQGAESSNQKGLCGQLDRGYYVADDGKSFNSIISGEKYTLSQIKPAAKAKAPKAKLRLHILEARKEQGYRLRVMYRSLGWSRAQCAKFLHVSERTLHNWECGRHEIPYAAYKLLRIHCGMELPGSQWRDWSFSRGKLWTPEGHGLTPKDAAWWSLLTLRAELGAKAIRELHALRSPQRASAASQHGAAPAPTCGSAELAPGADAVSGAAAQPARGLVSYKTSRPFSPSKIIAPNSYTVFCYKF